MVAKKLMMIGYALHHTFWGDCSATKIWFLCNCYQGIITEPWMDLLNFKKNVPCGNATLYLNFVQQCCPFWRSYVERLAFQTPLLLTTNISNNRMQEAKLPRKG